MDKEINNIELNAILYYADFLSLKHIGHPVTDNCKYFFIHGAPINSLFILDLEPEYDKSNVYYQQAYTEYSIIRNKYGDEGVESFIDDICSIKACGSVNAEQMLKCIHQYSSKIEKKLAYNAYYKWKRSQTYAQITINEDGNPQETKCSSYTYHVNRMLERSRMVKMCGTYTTE